MTFDRIQKEDAFYDWLDDEFAWRRIELAYHESLVQKAKASSEQLIIRGAIPILYAHWEGFVKAAGTAYLEFVLSRNKTFEELNPNFLALGMKKHLHEAESTLKGKIFVQACELIVAKRTTRAYFITESVIDTKFNLNYEVFENILSYFPHISD